MAPPLEYKRRVRMPDPEDPPMPRARRSPVIAVGVLTWFASVAVAWGVNAGTFPVASWLESGPEPARAQPRRAPRAPLPPLAPLPRQPELVAEARTEPAPTLAPAPELAPEPEPTASEAPIALAMREPSLPRAELPPAPAPEAERPALPAPEPRTPEARTLPPEPPAELDRGPGQSDGQSCEAAAAAANDELRIGGPRGPADLSAADYAKVLNGGGYLAGCGVPDHARVDVCAAVRNGRAVGVTVRLTPRAANVERCVARAVRRLAFPSHPRLDVARTRFE